MSRRTGWAGEQRNARRVLNQHPAEEGRRPDGNSISVAKHVSGKQSLYMLFLNRVGRARFYAQQNRTPYEPNNEVHKEIMTRLWNAWQIDPADRETYLRFKDEVDTHNRDRSLVSKTKHAKAAKLREIRHRLPDVFENCRTEHLRAQEESKNKSTIEIARDIDQIYIDEDLDAFCCRRRERTKENLDAYFRHERRTSQNPLCKDEYMIHLVSVMPYRFITHPLLKNVSCYPAEVSITTFNLLRGIIRNSSKIVKMDSEWYDPDGNKVQDSFFEDNSGLNEETPPASAEYPYEVFSWLQSQIDLEPNARILCDQKQFKFVYYGLYTMAVYTGHNAKRYFNDIISTKLLGIQDFTKLVLDVSPLNKPDEPWEYSMIVNQFLQNVLPRQDLNLFCDFHEKLPTAKKCHCTKAHNARLIHNFYKILRINRLQGFEYNPPVHELCIVDSRTVLPALLEDPVHTREKPELTHVHAGYFDYVTEEEEEEEDDDDDDEDEGEEEFRLGNTGYNSYPTALQNSRLVNVREFNPVRPSPRARDLRSPTRSPVRFYDQHVFGNERESYRSYDQGPSGHNRDQEPFRHNHDQGSFMHNHNHVSYRNIGGQLPFRHNDDQGPIRHNMYDVQSPDQNNTGSFDSRQPNQGSHVENSDFVAPTERRESPDQEDWETPQLLICKSRTQSEEYIKIARKGTTKQFKPIDLDF